MRSLGEIVEHTRAGLFDTIDPARLLPAVFGEDTSVQPYVTCADLGAWVGGWTVLVRHEGNVFRFRLHAFPDDGDAPSWEDTSAGGRFDRLRRAAAGARLTPSVDALARSQATRLAVWAQRAQPDWSPFTVAAALDDSDVWFLRHALTVLAADGLAEGMGMLLALEVGAGPWAAVRQLLIAAENVLANHTLDPTAMISAVAAVRGVDLSGYDIERLDVASALLAAPLDEWEPVAARLLAARGVFETAPPPPPSSSPPGSGPGPKKPWPWIIAA